MECERRNVELAILNLSLVFTLNTRFLTHGATTLFKLDDKTITLSGESPFQIVLEYVKNISL